MGKYSFASFIMRLLQTVAATVVLAIAFLVPVFAHHVNAQENYPVDLVLFYGRGCPHCAGMLEFLEEMEENYPDLSVHTYEIYFQKDNIPLFQQVADAYGAGINAVPTAFIGGKSFVGFSRQLGVQIEDEIARCTQTACLTPLRYIEPQRAEEPMQEPAQATIIPGGSAIAEETKQAAVVPLVPVKSETSSADSNGVEQREQGRQKEEGIDLANTVTIPAVLGAAIVDAINPCAFAVLIILITTILASGKKRRALFSGLAFSLSIFISYFLMGLGLYSAIQASGFIHTFYAVIAVLAIFIGLFNLKDYLWYGKWFVMEVPMSWRPRLKALLRGVTSVPGAFFTGFAVSLFLLPCTSGPYIVVLGLLAHTTTKSYALVLLAFYNLIFVAPMILITVAVYFGLTTVEKAEQCRMRCLKILHLVAGLIILGLGIVMLGSLWLGYI